MADVIKEFLVALGWKIDEPGLKKFETSIGRITKETMEFGKLAGETATVIQEAVDKIARKYEDLYYTSRRTGAAVATLQAFEFAANQIGLTSERARGAVEGLAGAMRTNPGVAGLMNMLGVKTAGRDTVAILNDLVGHLKEMPFRIAARYGAIAGISPDDLLMLEQGWDKSQEAAADYAKRQKAAGIDTVDLTEKSVEFAHTLNKLESDFGILADRIGNDFIVPATAALHIVDNLVQGFNNFDNAIGGVASTISTVLLSALGVTLVKALALKTVFRGLVAEAAAEGAVAAGAEGAAAAGGGGVIAGAFGLASRFTGVGTFLYALLNSTSAGGSAEAEWEKNNLATRGGTSGRAGGLSNNPGNLRSWGGVSSAGGFAQFGDAASGMSAMAQQLLLYGGRGLNTLSGIIGTYAPPSENDTAGYIADVSQRTGFGANQPLNLRDPSTLQKVMDAMIWHEKGANPYGIDMEKAAVNARLGIPNVPLSSGGAGGTSANISQKTDINIMGGPDSGATARAVVDAQQRVNGDLVRNTAGVVR